MGSNHFSIDNHTLTDGIKNIRKSYYLTSQTANVCLICLKQYKRITHHYKRSHASHEVFISRLSPEMAKQHIESSSISLATVDYCKTGPKVMLKMQCPFCEIVHNFYAPYWQNHLRTHTGEYNNECIDCGKISLNSTHCSRTTLKAPFNLHTNGIMAFICTICNYVQIDEQRIKSHLETQHELATADSAYQMITICPPLKSIRLRGRLLYTCIGVDLRDFNQNQNKMTRP